METIGETRAPTHGDVANVLDLVIQLATMTISQNELIERLTGEKHRPVPISMEDLQKAIADRDEGSARDGSRNQNSLKAVSRIRELFGHRGGSEEGPTKNYRCPSPSLTDHTVVFSKDEIGVDGVDGVEAPPPDPFQSFKNPREEEARMGGSTRCREESIECEGKKEGQGGFGMLPLEAGSQKCVLEKANQSMEKGKIGRFTGAEPEKLDKWQARAAVCEGDRESRLGYLATPEAYSKPTVVPIPSFQAGPAAKHTGWSTKTYGAVHTKTDPWNDTVPTSGPLAGPAAQPAGDCTTGVGITMPPKNTQAGPLGNTEGCSSHLVKGCSAPSEEALSLIHAAHLLEKMPNDDPQRVQLIQNVACIYDLRYTRTGDFADLQHTIFYREQVLNQTPRGHPYRFSRLQNLANYWGEVYRITGKLDDLEQGILHTKDALATMPKDHFARACWTIGLAYKFDQKYLLTNELGDLESVIVHLGDALALESNLEEEKTHSCAMSIMANMQRSKYKLTGAVGDLEQAVSHAIRALERTKICCHRSSHTKCLLGILDIRYEKTGSLEDLQQAINYSQQELSIMEQQHPFRPCLLNRLSVKFSKRYGHTGTKGDLEQAMIFAREATAATPPGHKSRANHLSCLADLLGLIHQQTGDIRHLHEAISCVEEALKAVPKGHPKREDHTYRLCKYLSIRYGLTNASQDLEQAIALGLGSLEKGQQNHNLAKMADLVARSLYLRFERTGDKEDLQQAILHGEQALIITEDSLERLRQLDMQARRLDRRFHQTGAADDLNKAIQYRVEVATSPQHSSDRYDTIAYLVNNFGERYRLFGNISDLLQAIAYGEEICAALPQQHPIRITAAVLLTVNYETRYNSTGVFEDLEQAINFGLESLKAIPQNHTERARFLDCFANILYSKYHDTNDMEDLKQAIMYGEETLATSKDDPQRPAYLKNQAWRLNMRYLAIGAMDELQQSILHVEEALGVAIPESPPHPCHLDCLALSLVYRSSRTEATEDLKRAILYSKEALNESPTSSPYRAYTLCLLANEFHALHHQQVKNNPLENMDSRNALIERQESLPEQEQHLQQAISYARQAVTSIPQNTRAQSDYMMTLSTVLYCKYTEGGAAEDLHQAILYQVAALAITPNSPAKALRLCHLAYKLFARFRLMDRLEDIGDCLDHLRAAWSLSRSLALYGIAIQTALLFTHVCHKIKRAQTPTPIKSLLPQPEETISILEGTVLLLPRANLRSLDRFDQQYKLIEMAGLGNKAAFAALGAGNDAYRAMKLLELSRGVIIGFTIDCRDDISNLKQADPDLFNRFRVLRAEIDRPLADWDYQLDEAAPPSGNSQPSWSQDRKRGKRIREMAVNEMEEAVSKIRALPGYAGFQLPPSPEELMSMASAGPIVTIIADCCRSDAIIVTDSEISTIHLPKLIRREILDRLQKIPSLLKGGLATYKTRNKEMQETLLLLWDAVVEPVLKKLQIRLKTGKDSDADLTHIWWIGVGELSSAPFHAAGNYSGSDPTQNILSYAVSSYTPTIKALSYARENDFILTRDSAGMPSKKLLLVSMPETPGQRPLTSAGSEVAEITHVTEGSVVAEHLEMPSAKDVLDQLSSCDAVHFACHGISDAKNPSSSHLLLLKDNKVDKLTVQDISTNKAKKAQIAYLSACSTAENRAGKLVDEMIHIASGFQLSGFSHVMATQWETNSTACQEVSTEFYRLLFDVGEPGEGHWKVRMSFHRAVKEAQQKYIRQPLKWFQFIHMGA